ncbi:uncharacterized protein EV422DRAFT_505209 [Fimicolochytrium jonesii]|uniref:uncharacterized protein n=1 Tax=Fimicolochytrium jonesii TaxID=1396493 RepID=UPI0022FE2E97|nr:uncharacterized protein EV422DRAFT_505209 [Fimicolochytrium jonesii]KAI8823196.1 hypothetical protein EV422DRAFT_505209 [Fimicolochytrium jonesii]
MFETQTPVSPLHQTLQTSDSDFVAAPGAQTSLSKSIPTVDQNQLKKLTCPRCIKAGFLDAPPHASIRSKHCRFNKNKTSDTAVFLNERTGAAEGLGAATVSTVEKDSTVAAVKNSPFAVLERSPMPAVVEKESAVDGSGVDQDSTVAVVDKDSTAVVEGSTVEEELTDAVEGSAGEEESTGAVEMESTEAPSQRTPMASRGDLIAGFAYFVAEKFWFFLHSFVNVQQCIALEKVRRMAAIYRANYQEAQGVNRPKSIAYLRRQQIGQALDYGHLDAYGRPNVKYAWNRNIHQRDLATKQNYVDPKHETVISSVEELKLNAAKLQTRAYKDAMEFLKAEKGFRERELFLDRITPSRRPGTAVSVGTSTSTSGLPIPDQTGYVYNYPAEVTAQTGLQFQAPAGGKEVPEEKLNLNTKNMNPMIQTRETEIRLDPVDRTYRVGVASRVVDRPPKFTPPKADRYGLSP